MKTSKAIKDILSERKSSSFQPDVKIIELSNKLGKVRTCQKLLPSQRKRGPYFNDSYSVGCNKNNLSKANETAFSRALFNQRFISLAGKLAILLDYEVYLSEDKAQKVDLLAYKPLTNTLVAIEYKIKPENSSTGVEYGLLESLCYGYLLEKYIAKASHVTSEIQDHLKKIGIDYVSKLIPDPSINPSVEYLLAAPVSYFEEFVKSGKKAEKRFSRIISIEKALRDKSISNTSAVFSGYLVLSEVSHKSSSIVDIANENTSFPYLSCLIDNLTKVKSSIIKLKK